MSTKYDLFLTRSGSTNLSLESSQEFMKKKAFVKFLYALRYAYNISHKGHKKEEGRRRSNKHKFLYALNFSTH